MTIVGIEKRGDGALELLVFDPMFRDPPAIRGLVGRVLKSNASVDKSLKLYRRGNRYLKKYHEFEVLEYVHPRPASLLPARPSARLLTIGGGRLIPDASRTPVPVTGVDGSSTSRHARQ